MHSLQHTQLEGQRGTGVGVGLRWGGGERRGAGGSKGWDSIVIAKSRDGIMMDVRSEQIWEHKQDKIVKSYKCF